MDIKISGIDKLNAKLSAIGKRQIPYALNRALNDTAFNMRDAAVKEMKASFDRPTPFVLKSVKVLKASNASRKAFKYEGVDMTATVGVDPYEDTLAKKILAPEIFGGPRKMKGFEKKLRNAGILPAGMYCVPGNNAPLDRYGNVSQGTIVQILSQLQILAGSGYFGNQTERSRKRKGIKYDFFVEYKNGVPIGIKKSGTNRTWAIMYFYFVKGAPSYAPRYAFHQAAQNAAFANFRKNFNQRFRETVKTAR